MRIGLCSAVGHLVRDSRGDCWSSSMVGATSSQIMQRSSGGSVETSSPKRGSAMMCSRNDFEKKMEGMNQAKFEARRP